MKATPEMQARLLELQDLDTRIAQLEHRLASLPEQVDISRMEGEEPGLQADVVRTGTEVSDLEREVAKAEAAVQQVRDRAARDQQRLEAGTGSAKDLQGLQHELESLARRQTVLEDEELEVMERVEQAQEAERAATAARDEHASRLGELRSVRDEKSAAIGSERDDVAAGREAIVADLSAELLALYERLRTQLGSGAAQLQQRRCGGCRLELNAVDLGRIRAAAEDEVVRCEECGRILVRTAESGL
ncbi:zinc ribbon domain-containing protein [Serinicoccus kebangsaanensis]|uniref:zinc ribbon domain-containing protein n=1 Tax=Serinicoccus kebangsaanensis TaxID=2602069 RepID=UPI00124EEBF2|nr:C4-type zinc ribbon domain-containing protein [Serinicoccus kebangsaanensis]